MMRRNRESLRVCQRPRDGTPVSGIGHLNDQGFTFFAVSPGVSFLAGNHPASACTINILFEELPIESFSIS
jgi:hypothetical protein